MSQTNDPNVPADGTQTPAPDVQTTDPQEAGDGTAAELSAEEQLAQLKHENGILRRKNTKLEKAKQLLSDDGDGNDGGSEPLQKTTNNAQGTIENPDDVFIITSNGLNTEQYKYALNVAKLNGIPLSEAVNHFQFTSWKQHQEAEAKKHAATMGASRGSGVAKAKKTFKTVTTREEHKALWKEKMQG